MRQQYAVVLLATAALCGAAAGDGAWDQAEPRGSTRRPGGVIPEAYVIGSIVAFETRSRVPMGFELQPFGAMPVPSEAPPPDARVVPLPVTPPVLARGDLRVPVSPPLIRQALDDFVAVNPRYEWVVNGPLIRVMPAGAATDDADWLNAAVPSLDLRGVTVREALVALRRLFDPAYDETRVVPGRMPSVAPSSTDDGISAPGEGLAPAPGSLAPATLQQRVDEALARRFDVTMQGGRVRDVLDAIVLGHGDAGWLVTFDGNLPLADHARVTIALWQASSIVAYPTAIPARVSFPPASPTAPTAPRLVTVPFARDVLRTTLSGVAAAHGRAIGFRLGPECGGTNQPTPARVLNLAGVPLEEAIDLTLAHCAGYERRDVDGVPNVVPTGSVGKDVVLDGRRSRFKLVNLPFSETMFEAANIIARYPVRPRRPPRAPLPGTLSERLRARALDQAKPVTVDLKKATLRAALNAVVAAHGAAWWAVEGPLPSGLVRLTIGGAGWSESWTGEIR